ncbi:hypothetical protein E2C01_046790 [Portunus trituberculatus]|uniref:Uncharacterized protein n=1 Tax=Portunus trituberculatus TaxID=210409 RepID=A0A5B7FZG9_PORTR|nr:hypothetical protein [Portunus trituberculatus]
MRVRVIRQDRRRRRKRRGCPSKRPPLSASFTFLHEGSTKEATVYEIRVMVVQNVLNLRVFPAIVGSIVLTRNIATHADLEEDDKKS